MRSWTGPEIFVGSCWATLFAAAIYYVLHFGAAEPFGDEWDLIPGLTYQEPYLKWLWAQHNEHRLPLAKLTYTWLLNLSGFDARVGGLATVGVFGALALALIGTTRRLRGRTDYADAFFPIAFLNWGHFENYLIGFQISFALSTALACGWLLATMHPTRLRWQLLPLLLLPLCGAHGLVYTIPLGLATLWLTRQRSQYERVNVYIAVATSLLLTAIYFRAYVAPVNHPASTGIIASSRIALEVLALGWGWVGQMTWPVSGVLIAGVMAATALLLAKVSQVATFRDKCIPLVSVSAGVVGLAFGIGWGRSGFGPVAGFAVRYGILVLPMMIAIYMAWVQFGGRVTASLVPMSLFTVACLFLTQHCRTGLSEGRLYAAQMKAFAADLQSNLAPIEIAQRHPGLYPNAEVLAQRIHQLRASGVRRYSGSNSSIPR